MSGYNPTFTHPNHLTHPNQGSTNVFHNNLLEDEVITYLYYVYIFEIKITDRPSNPVPYEEQENEDVDPSRYSRKNMHEQRNLFQLQSDTKSAITEKLRLSQDIILDEEISPQKSFFSEPREKLAFYSAKVAEILEPIQEDLGESKSTSTNYADKTRSNSQIQLSAQNTMKVTNNNKLDTNLMFPVKITHHEEDGLHINTGLYENISHNFDNLSPIENTNRKNIPEISNGQANLFNAVKQSYSEGEGYNKFVLDVKQKQELTEVPERSLESERTHDFSTVRSSRSNNVDLLKTRTNSPKHIFLKIGDNFNSSNGKSSANNSKMISIISNSNESSIAIGENNSKGPVKYIPSQINRNESLLKKKAEPIKIINQSLKSHSVNQSPRIKQDISTKQLHWQVRQIKQLEKEWNLDNSNSLQMQSNSRLTENSNGDSGLAKSNFLRHSANVLSKNQMLISNIQEENNTLAKIESNLLQIHKNKLLENERISILTKDQAAMKELAPKTYLSISRNSSQKRKDNPKYYAAREESLNKNSVNGMKYNERERESYPKQQNTIHSVRNMNIATENLADNDSRNILNTSTSRETRQSRTSGLSSIRPAPSDFELNSTLHRLNGTNNSNFYPTSGKEERFSASDRLFYPSSSNPNLQMKSWTDFTVYDRNSLWLNAKKQKMDTLQNSKAKEELSKCTFKPRMSSKNSNSIIWSPANATPNSTKDHKNNYSVRSGSANSAKSHSRTRSLSQEKKMNTSYSKFFEIKRNLDTYKNVNLSKTFNSSRRIESPKDIVIENKNKKMKSANISYTERILKKETVKVAEMLNNLKKSKKI